MSNLALYTGKLKRMLKKDDEPSSEVTAPVSDGDEANIQPFQASQTVYQAAIASQTYRDLLKSFLIFVIAPTILLGGYFLLFAPDRYVSESHFVVRNSEQKSLFEPAGMKANLVRSFTGGGVSSSMQDAYIIVDYVRSRSVVQDLQKEIDLAAIYSSNKSDIFIGIGDDPTLEEMWEYWNERVFAYVDVNSGVVQLRIEAFSPEEAKTISDLVIKSSERLVNDLSLRSRDSALRLARKEMEKAWSDYSSLETVLRDFRNKTSVLDPAEAAKSVNKLLLGLQTKKASLKAEIATLRANVKGNSPALVQRQQQLKALDSQISELRQELTSEQNDQALSAVLSGYEKIQIERLFKEKLYEIATKSFENARSELDAQRLFVDVVVPPNVPELALYPNRGFNVLFVFSTAAIFWAIAMLMMAAIRDHM